MYIHVDMVDNLQILRRPQEIHDKIINVAYITSATVIILCSLWTYLTYTYTCFH